jgi:hypothetical protein
MATGAKRACRTTATRIGLRRERNNLSRGQSGTIIVPYCPQVLGTICVPPLPHVLGCLFDGLFPVTFSVRGFLFSREIIKSGLGDAAGFSSVDFRIAFLPQATNSMSSLSSRLSLICPKPNEACSIQSRAFQFLRVCFLGGCVLHFHKCAYPLCECHQSDRGGLEGQNVAINPCPPTKDYPLFCLADRLFSLNDTSQEDDPAGQNCTFRTGGGRLRW